jgi:hypothetical protein
MRRRIKPNQRVGSVARSRWDLWAAAWQTVLL